jgi:hypothetical protein
MTCSVLIQLHRMALLEQRHDIAEQLINGLGHRDAITVLCHQRAALLDELAKIRHFVGGEWAQVSLIHRSSTVAGLHRGSAHPMQLAAFSYRSAPVSLWWVRLNAAACRIKI